MVMMMGRNFGATRSGRLMGWRRRLAEYGTAFVLTMALFSPAGEDRPKPTFAVVRLLPRPGPPGFDPREVVPSGAVLTIPIAGRPKQYAHAAQSIGNPN